MKLLWLEIETKTDILALAAFLISLLSIGYNVRSFLAGSQVELIPPTQAILVATQDVATGKAYTSAIVRFSYVNVGDLNYNALVVEERVEIAPPGPEAHLFWHAFVATTTDLSVRTLGGQLKAEFREIAAPFVLAGGGSVSHETFFASRQSFLPIETFLRAFDPIREEGGKLPLTVVLTASVRNHGMFRSSKDLETLCIVEIRLQDLEALSDASRGYAARPCVDASSERS